MREWIVEKSGDLKSGVRFGLKANNFSWESWRNSCTKKEGRYTQLKRRKNQAGCFLLCTDWDKAGKPHEIAIPMGGDQAESQKLLVSSLRGAGNMYS